MSIVCVPTRLCRAVRTENGSNPKSFRFEQTNMKERLDNQQTLPNPTQKLQPCSKEMVNLLISKRPPTDWSCAFFGPKAIPTFPVG